MVSEPGGLKFEPWPHILLHVIIPAYRSSYSGARVAQTNCLSGRPCLACSRGECWNPIKVSLAPSISPEFYSRRRSFSIMVSEPGGLKFEPRPHILLRVIIPAYKSSYGGAHVA
jgi:hypothetical protein